MSTSLYLLRVEPAELDSGDDKLLDLAWSAVDMEEELMASGRLEAIDTAWQWLDALLVGDDGTAPGPAALPVLGGRPVAEIGPGPMLALDADEVNAAAGFLRDISFDTLWEANRGSAAAAYGPGFGDGEQETLLVLVEDVTAFYRAAADAGDAVLKWIDA